MKIPTRSSQSSGFTLVELLVVIAIIALLASVLAVSAGSVINSAKRAKASSNINQIQTACLNYYTEYGVYPATSQDASTGTPKDYTINDTEESDWADFSTGLSGNLNPSTGQTATSTVANSRNIAFLNMKNTDVDKSGAPLNPLPPSTTSPNLYFNIAVDTDYDGILGVSPSAVNSMPNFSTGTTTSLSLTGGSSTAGIALWVNCTATKAAATNNANFWEHTY
jgi:prepilin-type N-terminal cleavage/methylation domain-containing protein